ncbi:3-hydroxyacyl-CoA dehydrogenase family protein [Hymenobacter qilianensis]|nr:3-hydroxyacyl-CoA dehydrogenase family protein [Hymenobacter qilianensis]
MEAEFRQKFGSEHEYTFLSLLFDDIQPDKDHKLVYDEYMAAFELALRTATALFFYRSDGYFGFEKTAKHVVFFETSSQSVADLGKEAPLTFGFCGLPTLLNRPLLEVSLNDPENAPQLAEICAALGTDYRVVQDRVGLVTPRVVCMLINEACYTLQEGTASIQDIDKSMKLGTSYPRGPFEWANLIGVGRVYDVLESLWQDTHEERYKVCPLLKTMHLRGESFRLAE